MRMARRLAVIGPQSIACFMITRLCCLSSNTLTQYADNDTLTRNMVRLLLVMRISKCVCAINCHNCIDAKVIIIDQVCQIRQLQRILLTHMYWFLNLYGYNVCNFPEFHAFFVVDYSITKKAFGFPSKNNMPFYFVSASDGTNVVQVGTAIDSSCKDETATRSCLIISIHKSMVEFLWFGDFWFSNGL